MLNLKKEQSGVGHVVIIAGIVVIAVIAFVGWKVSGGKSTSSTTASKAVASACEKEINDKNFCKFAASYTLTASYEATVDSTDASGAKTSMILKSDSKSNSSIVTTEAGKETAAYISLDGDTYFKDESTGSWTKIAGSKTAPAINSPTSDIKLNTSDFAATSTISYKFIAKEKVGKLNCFKYQVVDKSTPATIQYVWFDDKNYQMQKWSTQDSTGSMEMTFSYKSVTISAPTPISTSSSTDSAAALQAAEAAAAALNSASTDTTSTDTAQ